MTDFAAYEVDVDVRRREYCSASSLEALLEYPRKVDREPLYAYAAMSGHGHVLFRYTKKHDAVLRWSFSRKGLLLGIRTRRFFDRLHRPFRTWIAGRSLDLVEARCLLEALPVAEYDVQRMPDMPVLEMTARK